MMLPLQTRHRLQGGFTLIELICVITIIAVTSAVVVPAYARFMATEQFRAAAATVESTFAGAHARAIQNDAPVVITFDTASQVLQVQSQTTDLPQDGPTALQQFDADWRMQHGGTGGGQQPSTTQSVSSLGQHAAIVQFEAAPDSLMGASMPNSVVFHPDGTSNAAQLALIGPNGQTVRWMLMPATGQLVEAGAE
ncbi:MAG: prepilin-type N-terminal cleavage/methylation domain-containing protein [Armatimonadetes bacterium]|nr:prepilin-type N-terminal cleavage/methylation domain-containing protein [Armatimonadota bacterium]MDE2207764.1 prepilin-type N-terminal cleavage/methylation domain-containing protein [Armatimonadota bacterium]